MNAPATTGAAKQLPLWHWCHICGRPLLPDPFAYDLVETHKACAWAALRWHSDIPTEFVDAVWRATRPGGSCYDLTRRPAYGCQ